MISKGTNKASFDASTMKKLTYILIATLLGIVTMEYLGTSGLDLETGPTITTIEKKVEVLQPLEATKFEHINTVSVIPPRGSCEDWMTQAGIPINSATRTLILNESGCRPTARNASSGACGIPQALPCSKLANVCPQWQTDPVCQLRWMDEYIKNRYGTWSSALATWQSRSPHWY